MSAADGLRREVEVRRGQAEDPVPRDEGGEPWRLLEETGGLRLGDVTSFSLPGGMSVYFTGHDVRHADGRQLQRVGIEPDVEVAPSLEGLREGRDEVLERAVEYLEEELGGGE